MFIILEEGSRACEHIKIIKSRSTKADRKASEWKHLNLPSHLCLC